MTPVEYTEPPLARSVRCGTCGANTPVRGAGRQTCMYCGLPVELPADVQQEAERAEVRADLARSLGDLESELASESAAWPRFLAIFQFVCMLGWAVTWLDLMSRYGRTLTGVHIFCGSSVFIAPYFFWRIASGRSSEKELQQLASLSFAQLEDAPNPGGLGWRMSCPSCGGAVYAAQIDGLTISCTQCNSAMLAPAQLVEEAQRHTLQQVIVTRQRFLDASANSSLVTWAVGIVYVVVIILGFNVAELGDMNDDLSSWILWPHTFAVGVFLYWILTSDPHNSFWLKVYMGCPLPLAPVFGHILFYLDLSSKAPH